MKNSKLKNFRTFLILAIVVIIAGISIYQAKNQKLDHSKLSSATVLSQPRPIQAFNFTDNQGKPFTNTNLNGHWTMVFFGFTNCPYLCPTTMTELKKVYAKLAQDKIEKRPEMVMISIDPQRDTTERLNQYVHSFNKEFRGARAEKTKLQKMTRELGIVYMKTKAKNKTGNYSIDHSGTLLLFDPNGNLFALFSTPHHADSIAKDLEEIIKHA